MSDDFEPAAARSWDFPRSIAGTALLVAAGQHAGAEAATLLAGTGLRATDLADYLRSVTAEQELRVVRNLRSAAPGVSGVQVGASYHASTFGPMGFALMSSATLGEAANLALRFIDLSFTFTIPSAHVESTDVLIGVDDRGVPDDVRRFLVERDLAAIWTVLSEICGGGPTARELSLPFDAAAEADYRAAFGLTPRWNCPSTRATLRLDASWFGHPLPQANPHALALAEKMCRDVVAPRRRQHGFSEQVRILVAQRLAYGAPMVDVAATLGLSERSLRRRLAEAGTSYRGLVDEVRQVVADDLLSGGALSVQEVAGRLGYAEATSFGAAYRRWTGRTPRAR
ncbi:MAG: AraC family transcriptional regulator [Nocardioidaceae bacterium]|nr:AraC family transcriptional regulator [Nocardioidaceae bacterium]